MTALPRGRYFLAGQVLFYVALVAVMVVSR